MWTKFAACFAIASTTAGCAWPTFTTAMPAPRSISRLPSTSSTMPPCARWTKIGRVVPTPAGTARVRRSHSARERGPGISVTSLRFCFILIYPSAVASMAPTPRRAALTLKYPPMASRTSEESSTIVDSALIEGETPNLS